MSVTIHWRPTSDAGKHFEGGTSTSLSKLQEVFHSGPISKKDAATLRAMAVASGDQFFNEVADIAESVGEIEVWGKW